MGSEYGGFIGALDTFHSDSGFCQNFKAALFLIPESRDWILLGSSVTLSYYEAGIHGVLFVVLWPLLLAMKQ